MPVNKDVFIDTNVLIYLLSSDEIKTATAERLLQRGGTVSVQVLNELANVARRKLAMPWNEIREFVSVIRTLCIVTDLTESTQEKGIEIAERYQLSVYDSMILAAALENNCKTVFSEDLQSGLIVNKRLRVKSPFS